VEHLADPRGRVGAAALQHHADAAAYPLAVGQRVEAEDADRSGVGAHETLADLDRGGLAGAVRSEPRHDLTAVETQVQSRDRGGGAEPLDESLDVQCGGVRR